MSPILLLATAVGMASASEQGLRVRDCLECPQMIPVGLRVGADSKRLLVAKYELTWAEYLPAVEGAGCPAPRNRSRIPIDWHDRALWDDYPMTSIQPNEIGCYIRWINAKTGKVYRLPTEAEWTAIAVASGQTPGNRDYLFNGVHNLPVRHDPRGPVAWRMIRPVSLSSPNALGINDLLGNAAELVSDYTPSPRRLRPGGKPIQLVTVKGGYLGTKRGTDLLRSRMIFNANTVSDTVGFRLVRASD